MTVIDENAGDNLMKHLEALGRDYSSEPERINAIHRGGRLPEEPPHPPRPTPDGRK